MYDNKNCSLYIKPVQWMGIPSGIEKGTFKKDKITLQRMNVWLHPPANTILEPVKCDFVAVCA